jgi:gluconate 2-dehydrogenase gamma chain
VSGAGISRRELLRAGTLLGGGLWWLGPWSFPRAARAAAASSEPAVLDAAQWKALEAMTARILPTDGQPGAREAGCVNFIDKALAHEEAAARPLYAAGLAGVDAAAAARHAGTFASLPEAEQDALLAQLETGTAPGWPEAAGPSPVFFETVRVHTLIGFLADPGYGGNRGFAGWRVAGYPGPRHRRGGYTPEQVTGAAPVRPIWDETAGG